MLTSITTFLSQLRLSDGALLLIAAVVGVLVARGCHSLAKRADPRVRLFLILSLLNLSLLVILYAVPRAFAENTAVISVLTVPPPMLYEVPSVALFSVSFLKRYRDLLPLNGVAVALGLWALMGFRFALTAPPETDRNVTVMSWNLAGKSIDLHGIMNGIRASSPDIVCLQAVPADAILETRLPAYHWYQAHGLAIGSQGRQLERDAFVLPSSSRSAIESTVSVHGRNYDVLTFDLSGGTDEPGKARPSVDLRKLHALLADRKRRLVIAMALGAQPPSREYQTLSAGLVDAFEQSGTGFGYTTPARFPTRRSDYVIISPDCAARSAIPLSLAFSDHLPLRVIVGSLRAKEKTPPAK